MPYITSIRKEELIKGKDTIQSPGELNFKFTALIIEYVQNHSNLSYQVINDVIGALEGAKLEFYRRVALPYEDQKRHDNGDVYDGLSSN